MIGDADTHLVDIFANHHCIVAVTGIHFEMKGDAIARGLCAIDLRLR